MKLSIVEVAIKDIKPNPFKKFINEGKLDKELKKKSWGLLGKNYNKF